MVKKPSYEYIRGLVEGSGNFTFTSNSYKRADGSTKKSKIPTFTVSMHARDYDLLCKVRDTIGLDNKVYMFEGYTKDGYNRGKKTFLTVREIGSLKDTIVPFFYGRLVGSRGAQFNDWLTTIGRDPLISEGFRIIYRLHKNGFYKNNPKFVHNVSR